MGGYASDEVYATSWCVVIFGLKKGHQEINKDTFILNLNS
jgi:hypothetical protein